MWNVLGALPRTACPAFAQELFPPWSSQARLEGTRCKISQCLVSVLCNETPSFGLRRFPLPNLPLLPDPQQPHPSFTLLLTSSSSAPTVGRDEVGEGVNPGVVEMGGGMLGGLKLQKEVSLAARKNGSGLRYISRHTQEHRLV